MVTKASKRLHILIVLKRAGIPSCDLIHIYLALVRSVLEYACVKKFFVSSGLDLVIYCANVWNEREADNAHERRDFEDDEVKSHLGLSSAQPFNC